MTSADLYDNDDECPVCGGDGYIMASDGDGSDWGEDTYSGPMDAVIKCRHCNGAETWRVKPDEVPHAE